MKRMLMRPSAALFPVVGIVSALFGNEMATFVLFFFYYCLQVITLCAADCFRNAAGREPGVRRVDMRFGGAIAQMLIGFALAAVALVLMKAKHFPAALAAAACIYIEHLFEERNFALGRNVDGTMIAVISNALLLAGLLIDGGRLENNSFQSPTLYAAAAGAVISIVTSYAVERPRGFSLVPRNLPFALKAMDQTLLYPILAIWLFVEPFTPESLVPALYGLLIWRLARTNCRRSADETRPLNLILMVLSAIPMIFMAWFPSLYLESAFSLVAMMCVISTFCASGWRVIVGGVFLGIAWLCCIKLPLGTTIRGIVGTGFSLAAVILNLKNAFLRKVR